MSDRMIHAKLIDLIEVVRYDRAGKWYIENLETGKRKHVGVLDAAEEAARIYREGGIIYFDRPGGSKFDQWARAKCKVAAASDTAGATT